MKEYIQYVQVELDPDDFIIYSPAEVESGENLKSVIVEPVNLECDGINTYLEGPVIGTVDKNYNIIIYEDKTPYIDVTSDDEMSSRICPIEIEQLSELKTILEIQVEAEQLENAIDEFSKNSTLEL